MSDQNDFYEREERPPWCSEHGRWECDEHGERCQHGNLLDDGCDKCEATKQYLDEFSARGNNAGGEDVCLPALSPAPPQTLSPPCPGTKIPSGVGRGSLSDGGKPLQLDYPAWRMSFSAYGEHLGLEVPA